MKHKRRIPSPFTYEGKNFKITGSDDNRWLLILCILHSLRWYLLPLIGGTSGGIIGHWIQKILSG